MGVINEKSPVKVSLGLYCPRCLEGHPSDPHLHHTNESHVGALVWRPGEAKIERVSAHRLTSSPLSKSANRCSGLSDAAHGVDQIEGPSRRRVGAGADDVARIVQHGVDQETAGIELVDRPESAQFFLNESIGTPLAVAVRLRLASILLQWNATASTLRAGLRVRVVVELLRRAWELSADRLERRCAGSSAKGR